MLRISNRVVTNTNTSISSKSRKCDSLELLALIEKCTQIMRDDRILLRSAVKENNTKLVDSLQRYRKRGVDDLPELQIELRRVLNELKGRKMTSPEKDFKKKSCKENVLSPVHKPMSTRDSALTKVMISVKSSPLPSEEDQLQFMTVVSQTPYLSTQKEQQEEVDCTSYNTHSCNCITLTTFPYILPELESLNYRQECNSTMYTDWQSILKPTHIPAYQQTEKTVLPYIQMPDSIMFRIKGIPADQLFAIIFPSNCIRKINFYQMKLNIERGIEESQLDLDMLFKMFDQDQDGWATIEDVGEVLESICENTLASEEMIMIERLMAGQAYMSASYLQSFLDGRISEMESVGLGRSLFSIVDMDDRGYVTKWDLFQNRQLEQVQRLMQLLLI